MAKGGNPPLYTSSPCRWQGCSNPVLVGETYCSACKEHILQHMWDGGCRHVHSDTGWPCETPIMEKSVEGGVPLFCRFHEGDGNSAIRPYLPPALQTPEPAPYETILEEATRITAGDRNRDYGHPLDNFQQTADMLTAFFIRKLKPGCRIEAREVPWVNILQKASRDSNAPKRDNFTDTAGYAHVGQVATEEQERRAAEAV